MPLLRFPVPVMRCLPEGNQMGFDLTHVVVFWLPEPADARAIDEMISEGCPHAAPAMAAEIVIPDDRALLFHGPGRNRFRLN